MNFKQINSKFRAFVNKHSAAVTVAAILLALGSAAMLAMRLKGAPEPTGWSATVAYYYDLSTGKLFSGAIEHIPPILVPGAPADARPMGVQAYVFACRDCGEAEDRYVGYLEIFNSDAYDHLATIISKREQLQLTPAQAVEHARMSTEESTVVRDGRLIAKPEPTEPGKAIFVPFHSEAGEQIIRQAAENCGEGRQAMPCHPPAP